MQSLRTPRGIILIRQSTSADAAQFRHLRLDALQESPTAFPADYAATTRRPSSYWQDRLRKDENAILFFAEHKAELIGMTGIRRGESSKTKHSAEIWGVYVRPAWRGLRIAESLIEESIRWAKSNGVNIVKLGVTTASTAALRCYQRCGFIICAIEPRGIFYDGHYYDGYLMYRLLDDL